MSGDVVNLRQFRKQKARSEKATPADLKEIEKDETALGERERKANDLRDRLLKVELRQAAA